MELNRIMYQIHHKIMSLTWEAMNTLMSTISLAIFSTSTKSLSSGSNYNTSKQSATAKSFSSDFNYDTNKQLQPSHSHLVLTTTQIINYNQVTRCWDFFFGISLLRFLFKDDPQFEKKPVSTCKHTIGKDRPWKMVWNNKDVEFKKLLKSQLFSFFLEKTIV